MYLDYFQFKAFPFSLTPNTQFYCNLPTYQEALNTIILSLNNGEGFIKVVGEVGSGKTLLCRLLLNYLNDKFVTAYVPNPNLDVKGLYKSLARELAIEFSEKDDETDLLHQINTKLCDLYREGKRVVVLIDEAQVMPLECFETLRLLSNLETESDKLLQIVMFGQPELDGKLNRVDLRQLLQRITFAYYLRPLKRQELHSYLRHRLAMAGRTHGELFSKRASRLLFKASQGIPRLVNILCHKALMVTYSRHRNVVKGKDMKLAIRDTESAAAMSEDRSGRLIFLVYGIAVALLVILGVEVYLSLGL